MAETFIHDCGTLQYAAAAGTLDNGCGGALSTSVGIRLGAASSAACQLVQVLMIASLQQGESI